MEHAQSPRAPQEEAARDVEGSAAGLAPDEASATLAGGKCLYQLSRLLAVGEVADVHLGRGEGGGAYVVKASRSAEGDGLLDNERRVLARLTTAAGDTTYRRYLPTLADSFIAAGGQPRRVNVFPHRAGWYTLEQAHARHPALDGRHLGWIFNRLLTVLGFCHSQGTLHGAVLPCHVLLHPEGHGLRLVGWGQSVVNGRRVAALSGRYRDWYPAEARDKRPASPATDLFLAARCLVYLAGGDAVTGRMPEHVPEAMRRFIGTCLLPGPRMRPSEAWGLLEEFEELLRRLYGPPRFQELTM